MELREYLRVIRRRWKFIASCGALFLAIAAGLTFAATPQYASSARLFVSTSQSDTAEAYAGGLFSVQRVASYADLIRSQELAESVKQELGLNISTAELSSQISAKVVPETVILEVTATNADASLAQAIAQAYAAGLTDLVREIETPTGEKAPPIRATIVDNATKTTVPFSPRPVRNLGLGALVGVLLGLGLALAREFLDNTVKGTEDIAAAGAPLLGSIAYDPAARSEPLITSLSSHAPRLESFRVLRTNLQFVDVDRSDKVFVVTSALPEEGKTSTAVNLALTLTQGGHKTVLVECDLRRPKATAALGVDGAIGVTTVLLGKVTLEDAIQEVRDSGLYVLGSGAIPPNPAELVQSKAMSDLLTQLRRDYDIVIIDAPPLLPVTDAALLASHADGALLVVRYGKTTKDQLAQATERLAQVDAAPIGVILNMVPQSRLRGSYGYGYGYAPEATAVESGGRRKLAAPSSRQSDPIRS